jgi:hypothetical protein
MKLFIDQESRLPLMITWQAPRPRVVMRRAAPGTSREDAERTARDAQSADTPPEIATFEMRLDEYRTVDGLQLPHVITRAINGQTNEEWTIKSYTVNPAFKSNTFTK